MIKTTCIAAQRWRCFGCIVFVLCQRPRGYVVLWFMHLECTLVIWADLCSNKQPWDQINPWQSDRVAQCLVDLLELVVLVLPECHELASSKCYITNNWCVVSPLEDSFWAPTGFRWKSIINAGQSCAFIRGSAWFVSLVHLCDPWAVDLAERAHF